MSEDERNIQIVFFEDCNPCLYCLCPFWSLDQSTINRYKQQGFQDAIFQTCFLELIKRYKCLKVFNMWSSRTFVLFSTSNSSVCWPTVANGTIFSFFFQMQYKQMGSTYPFPQLHQNCALLFWHWKTKRHSCLVIRRKEKYIFIWKQRCQLSCVLYGSHSKVTINMLFSKIVLSLGKLNLNNLHMSLCIAVSCILCLQKQPEKNWTLEVNAT